MQLLLERTEIHEAGKLADFGAALTTADAQALQEVLGTLNVNERIEKTLLLLKKELELSKLQSEISKSVEDKMSANQRRFLLMEQLKQIKKELGLEKDDKEALSQKFTERIADKTVPEDAQKTIDEELQKLSLLETSSSEFNVTRNYLDWLTALPWGVYADENLKLAHAEAVLADIVTTCKAGNLAKFEIPKKLILIEEEWTPENDMLTAVRKLKRKEIVGRHAKEINGIGYPVKI